MGKMQLIIIIMLHIPILTSLLDGSTVIDTTDAADVCRISVVCCIVQPFGECFGLVRTSFLLLFVESLHIRGTRV